MSCRRRLEGTATRMCPCGYYSWCSGYFRDIFVCVCACCLFWKYWDIIFSGIYCGWTIVCLTNCGWSWIGWERSPAIERQKMDPTKLWNTAERWHVTDHGGLPSLKLPKRKFLFQPSIFRCELLVSGRVGVEGICSFYCNAFVQTPGTEACLDDFGSLCHGLFVVGHGIMFPFLLTTSQLTSS